MKKIIVFSILIIICVIAYISTPFIKINEYRNKYHTIQLEMSYEEIIKLMGEPTQRMSPHNNLYWNDELINKKDKSPAEYEIWYTVETFFLPITHSISFSKTNKVVGKHVYD